MIQRMQDIWWKTLRELDALKRYLVLCPQTYDYKFDNSVRKLIRRALFHAVSDGGQYLAHFFPGEQYENGFETSGNVSGEAFEYGSSPKYDSGSESDDWVLTPQARAAHPRRPCARVFLKGEPIYRCLTCGLDETCAMCADCYDADAHKDHVVYINICMRSNNGGTCDCGDPEAWVGDVKCKHYTKEQKSDKDIPVPLQASLLGTLEVVLDYVIDVMNGTDICYLSEKHQTPAAFIDHSNSCDLDPAYYELVPDPNSEQYYLMLYNDYVRHYRDAVQRIHMATRKVPEFAEMVAKEIEKYGKAKVWSGTVKELLEKQLSLGATGLHSLIRSHRDVFREDMCDEIIRWIKSITESAFFQDYQLPRDVLCRAFCSKWGHGENRIPDDYPYQTGRMNNGLIPIIPRVRSHHNPDYWNIEAKRWELPEDICLECSYNLEAGRENDFQGEPFVGSRFQYLLYFDIRFWSSVRATLHSIYVTSLISNLRYKNTISCQYVDIYPSIADMFLRVDREPETSFMCDLSTQLFTTPTDATAIVKHGDLTRILSTIYGFLTMDCIVPPEGVDLSKQVLLSSLNNRKWGQVFFDLGYIINRNEETRLLFTGNFVRQACDVIALFQSRPIVVRAAKEHVEFESNDYTLYFSALSVICRFSEAIAKSASKLPHADFFLVESTLTTLVDLLSSIDKGEYRGIVPGTLDVAPSLVKQWSGLGINAIVSEYPVHLQNVSFLHPLHSFFSWLIELCSQKTPQNLLALANQQYVGMYPLLPYDYSLRSIVLLAQIKVGFWVRNGFSIKNQLHIYRHTSVRECGFMRDVFLCQSLTSSYPPDDVCLLFFYRWSLMPWVSGQVQNYSVYDKANLPGIVEECLNFFVWLLTENMHLKGLSEDYLTRTVIRKEIIHSLCFQSLSFSKIVSEVPEHVANLKKFEAVLKDLALYTPPSGLNDAGIYKLKEKYFDEVDPYYIHLTSNKRDDAIKLVKERIHKRTRKPLNDIYIEPRVSESNIPAFAGAGNFTTSILFAKFLHSTLNYTLQGDATNNESIIDLVLHVIHACAYEKSVTSTYRSFYNIMMDEHDGSSVASYMCHMLTIEGFKSYHSKIRGIFGVFVSKYQDVADILSQKFPALKKALEVDATATGAEPEAEHKRRTAKERRERVMAEFKKKQSQFAATNKVDTMDESDVEMVEADEAFAWKFPEEHCILCQMPSAEEEVFGIISHLSNAASFRKVPFNDEFWLTKAFTGSSDEDSHGELNEATRTYFDEVKAKSVFGPGFPSTSLDNVESRPVLSSCGHGMHFTCYKNYLVNIKSRQNQITRTVPENTEDREFLCPLCKAVNNVFVPVLWNVNNKSLSELLSRDADGKWHEPFDRIAVIEDESLVLEIQEKIKDEVIARAKHCVKSKYLKFFEAETSPVVEKCVIVIESVFHGLQKLNRPFLFDGDFSGLVVNTIESVEIALRGVSPEGGQIFDQLSHQVLTNLRVWNEFRNLNSAMLAMKEETDLPSFLDDVVANYQILASDEMIPCIEQGADLFESLVSCHIVETSGFSYPRTVRLCLMWHILQTAYSLTSQILQNMPLWSRILNLPLVSNLEANDLVCALYVFETMKNGLSPEIDVSNLTGSPQFGSVFYSMLVKCCVPYLRRCAIWAYVQCDNHSGIAVEECLSQENQLCSLLRIPPLTEIFSTFVTSGQYENQRLHSFASYLTRNNLNHINASKVEYPGIISLINLPERMDDFFTRYYYKDLNHENADPAVCLFCGAVVQIQGSSIGSRIGQCNLHVEKECISECGIFLVPRYCTLLLLWKGKGSFYKAPYLDPHGELDEEPRHGKPLYLNQKRYNAFVRNIWLNHGVQNAIARNLESVIDIGGWETL
ncbi:hypothetical protein BABINDRAFT_171021 [Babjeviella inositovora NRRL Y-12698]|uniref:E3 ubiquitin-protein ligase n=1 Tax=Babjeviella inositovora NRRL Y-12698 TaxID=984486 RepID=A0A1E3QT35_9ASCO|nr:uncharacterized protein BABINDRAFT_171021 [Babjeviella inositovora NRRL Y-12698]ODQ80664.1 hypothetical protein BABINDRAFT_171021 [Babjeviella inositovora NRRL Y-12698]